MKNNASLLSKIIWYDIDKDGFINKPLKYVPAVYIYMKITPKDSKPCYYVGSTIQLTRRISAHRCRINNNNTDSPIFYRSVLKYGWLKFKFGVLEYLDLSDVKSPKEKKNTLLKREQYYLDNINPSLNVCKKADSPLGVKRNIMFSINLSKSRRGKSISLSIKTNNMNNIPKIVTDETKLKISSRCKGISVKIFDKSNNLVKEFPTITSAAKYLGVTTKTVSMIYKTGKSYDSFVYKFDIKDNRVWVYDYNYKLVNILDGIKKASEWSKIPSSTIFDYIRSSKLYKNKYYFYNIKSESNPYFKKDN